jgi:nucleoside-diphosphate-sugar epimerase
VTDAAAAYRLLARRMTAESLGGEAFNFSCERMASVLDVTHTIIRQMGADVEPRVLGTAKNEITTQGISSAKARRLLGWAPAVDFEEGVRRTVEWYRSRYGARENAVP